MLSRFLIATSLTLMALPAHAGDERFVEACKVAIASATEGRVVLDGIQATQVHRRISLVHPGQGSPVTCVFRDLSDEVPELESLELNGHAPIPASDHPQWNEAIWDHFTSPAQ